MPRSFMANGFELRLFVTPDTASPHDPLGKFIADIEGEPAAAWVPPQGEPMVGGATVPFPPVTFGHEFVPFTDGKPRTADPQAPLPSSPLLKRLEDTLAALRKRGMKDADLKATFTRILHSPALALLVKLTPNSADNAALELLKVLFPAA